MAHSLQNTSIDVPGEWYRHEEHVGYNLFGKKLNKEIPKDSIENFLASIDVRDSWRKILDSDLRNSPGGCIQQLMIRVMDEINDGGGKDILRLCISNTGAADAWCKSLLQVSYHPRFRIQHLGNHGNKIMIALLDWMFDHLNERLRLSPLPACITQHCDKPLATMKDLTKLKFNTSALQLAQDNFKRFCMVLVCLRRHLVGLLSVWFLALSLLRLLPWCVSAPSSWKIAEVKLPWFQCFGLRMLTWVRLTAW